MALAEADALTIPGLAEPLSLVLPPALAALRQEALELHRGPYHGIAEVPLIDARTWASRADGEDWLTWRARRCAERLKAMPIDIEPGQRIVGKPLFRELSPDEAPQLEAARATLADVPPFPGGDTGHFHPDYEKLFAVGIGGILDEIAARRQAPGLANGQRAFYDACRIALEGMAAYVHRTADACDALALPEQAAVCRRVAPDPPATFHEAIQLMFLAEIALWFGDDHYLTSPGRMDQTLRRFYEADLLAGRTSPQAAFELICGLFIQLNRILWPGSAIAIMVGGPDPQGRDATNPLTYLCLAARLATRLVYPTVGVAWHEGTPRELMDFSTQLLATGLGDPAFFNDPLIAAGLRDHGVAEADAHRYMNSTCVEIKVTGASNMWVTAPYFNCPQALLDVVADAAAGRTAEPESFDALAARVRERLAGTVADAAAHLDAVWHGREERGGFPLASCLVRDCLERGTDFDRGGARYNWVENSFVGLANLVDGLAAVRHLVYETGELSLPELQGVLEADFAGCEPLRQRILNALPKYGNDNEEADALAAEWAEFLIETTESRTVGLHRYVPGFFCWVMHERMGSQTGATPDGRRAGLPLADGAGAAQGRERAGPTASLLSTTKWSHRKVLGGLVHNIKFSKSLLAGPEGRRALRELIETYLRRGGFEIQINVVGRDVLLDAQRHPEQYPDLLVRVAGYSDYFVHLNPRMQQEIIDRTEHEV